MSRIAVLDRLEIRESGEARTEGWEGGRLESLGKRETGSCVAMEGGREKDWYDSEGGEDIDKPRKVIASGEERSVSECMSLSVCV